VNSNEINALDAYSSAVSGAAERAGPAVVKVDVAGPPRPSRRRRGQNEQPPGPTPPPGTLVPYGSGSGVIFDSAGRVITNAHVVDNGPSISVGLRDGRK